MLASGDNKGTIRLWDAADPARARLLGSILAGGVGTGFYSAATINSVAFSSDGHALAFGNAGGTIQLWDIANPGHPHLLSEPLTSGGAGGGSVDSVAFSPGDHVLVSGDNGGTIRLWNLADPAHPRPLGQPLTGSGGVPVGSVAFSPGGHTLASGIAGGEAAGSTTLAAVGWLQYRARRNPPSRRSTQPGRTRRPAGRDRARDRWRRPARQADDDSPRWLTLSMTAGVTTALAAWGFTTGFTAIILAVAVDMMAASVNAYKTYRHPAGESMLSWWLFLAATLAALLAARHAAPILYAYPGVGALTAIAVITAWATGRSDHRSQRPAGSRPEPDTTPRTPATPRASDHSNSKN
jgi:hypothetical protein